MKIAVRLIKAFCLVLGLLSWQECLCQFKKIEFNGRVKGIDSGIVKILIEPSPDSNFVMLKRKDVILKNGIFKIDGEISYPYLTRIIINDTIFSNYFFIEPGKVNGYFLFDSLGKLSNNIVSKTNNEYLNSYFPKIKSVSKSIDNWYEKHYIQQRYYQYNIPKHIEDSMQLLKSSLRNQMDTLINSYILKNNKSYVGFWDLVNSIYIGGYTPLRYNSFRNIDMSLQNTYTGKKIKGLLLNEKKLRLGLMFPDMNLQDLSGTKVSILNNLSAKFTLLDFWFSFCGPCIIQFPKMKTLYSNFDKADFQMFGISVDKHKDKLNWLETVKNWGLLWPQYWDVNGIQANRLGINSYPQNVLIDKDGNIVAKNLEIEQIELFLLANLKLEKSK